MYNLTHPIKDTVWAKLKVTLRKEIPVTCVTPSPTQTPWRGHRCSTGRVQPRGPGNTAMIKDG